MQESATTSLSPDASADVDLSGAPQPQLPPVPWIKEWVSRPRLASVLHVTFIVAKLAVALLVTTAAARLIPAPSSVLVAVGWWIVLGGLATIVLEALDVLDRRFIPLSILLRMSLVFPDKAPSRFRVAFRAGSPKTIRDQLERAKRDGLPTDPSESCEVMLDLVSSLRVHDSGTRGHSERVRAYTEMIAEEMGVPEDERRQMRWAGLLHDVGKLLVPTEILNKPGTLGADEWEIVRQHPMDGLVLAANVRDWIGEHVLGIVDHHERWEGGGYPAGVAGEEISLAGRIVAVADAFDVMTSARSYKEPMSVRDAREELVRCSGTQFDPEVVRAFLAISIDRLRAALAPLGWVTAVAQIRWMSLRVPQTAQAATAAIAILTTAGLLGLGPTMAANASPGNDAGSNGEAVAAPSNGGEAPDPSAERPDGEPPAPIGNDQPGDVVAFRPPPSTGPGGVADGSDTDSPPSDATVPGNGDDRPAPSDPDPAPGPPGDGGGDDEDSEPGAIVIDLSEGRIALDNISVNDNEIPVIDLPIVGIIACDELGLCTPIEVPLPILLGG